MYQKEKIKRGVRVRVKSREGVFEGNVKYWNPLTEDLTIEPGYCPERKKNIADELNFYKNDLEYVITIDGHESETLNTSTSDEKTSSHGSHSMDRESVKSKSFVVSKCLDRKSSSAIDFKAYSYYWITESASVLTTLKLIESNQVKVIGLKLYGKLTRDGYVSLICIEVDQLVYVFDMLAIKEAEAEENENEVFQSLGELLKNPHVIKVMYKCSFASDILFHQYRITLSNVFDLEAAHAYVHTNASSKVDIEVLIEQNLPNFETNKAAIGCNDMRKTDWSKRPLSANARYTALRETSVLIKLYKIYYDKIFDKFSKGCDFYLSVVKNCQDRNERNEMYQNDEQILVKCQNLYNPKREAPAEVRMPNKNLNTSTSSMAESHEDRLNELIRKRAIASKTDTDEESLGSRRSLTINNNNSQLECASPPTSMKSIFTRPLGETSDSQHVKKYNLMPAGMQRIHYKPKSSNFTVST